MKFLNVGGNSKDIGVPTHFQGWEHVLLDIQAGPGVDLVLDARELVNQPAGEYDAVYCSHNLEHYYPHDAVLVLDGIRHVLKETGFVEIRVPDIGALVQLIAKQKLQMNSKVYDSPMGPITVQDIIYGYSRQIMESGNDFYAHKTGFMQDSLTQLLGRCGFPYIRVLPPLSFLEIHVMARKVPVLVELVP